MLKRLLCIFIFASGFAIQAGPLAAQADFASTVESTKPVAYFRLADTSGSGEMGGTSYKAQGGVSAGPGVSSPAGATGFVRLDGKSGMIHTTQSGGVKGAASIMAWVILAEPPSKADRIFYVAGESQSGNDLDLQFETDNQLKFFTAAGGSLDFTPPAATLANQWHMIVATLDPVSKARAIYWDGKPAAKDTGGGAPNKTAEFSIGASTVWGGRWFHGGMAEVALWGRALRPAEVASMYAAASAGGDAGAAPASAASGAGAAGAGPFATTAKVQADDAKGHIPLKREEQIALMFMSAIEQIEHDCQLKLQRACSMSEVMSGTGGEHLKFDPGKTDPNYTYTFTSGGMAWEVHANARKPGLIGLCFMSRSIGTTVTTYSASGKSGWVDTEILGRSIEGDLFDTQ